MHRIMKKKLKNYVDILGFENRLSRDILSTTWNFSELI